MSDDRFNTQEHLTKEEAYEEYLRLRQGARKAPSVTSTPYGASELRKRAKAQEAERQRQRGNLLRAAADIQGRRIWIPETAD